MNLIHGSHSPSGHHKYEYDATWQVSAIGLTWSATAYVNGDVVLRPEGVLVAADARNSESLVRSAVAGAIERRTSTEAARRKPG